MPPAASAPPLAPPPPPPSFQSAPPDDDPFAIPRSAPAQEKTLGFDLDFGDAASAQTVDVAPPSRIGSGLDLSEMRTISEPAADPALEAALAAPPATPRPITAPNPFLAAVSRAASAPVGVPSEDVSMLDFVDDGANQQAEGGAVVRWQVRRKSGKIFGPFDLPTIAAMLQQGQLFGNEEISSDGAQWKPISSEPVLAREIKNEPRQEPPGLAPANAPRVPPPVIPTMSASPSGNAAPAMTVPFEPSAGPTGAALGRRAMPVWVRLLMRRLPLLAAGAVVIVIVAGGIALGKFTSYGYFGMKALFGRGANGHSPAQKFIDKYDADSAEGTFSGAQAALKDAKDAIAADADLPEAMMDYAVISCRIVRRYGTSRDDLEKAKERVLKRLDRSTLEGKVATAAATFCDGSVKLGEAKALLDPIAKDRHAELLYGDVLLASKDYKAAATHLDAVLKAHPSGEAAMLRAEAAHGLNDAAGEEAALQKAQELIPGHARARLWLARLRVSQGKMEEAGELLKAVLADPVVRSLDASEEAALGHHLNGDVLVSQHKFQQAIKEYQAAAEGQRDNPKHLAAIALLELRLQKWKEAGPDFDKALEKAPNDVELLTGAGRVQTVLGNYPKATERLEDARRKAPNDPSVWVALGDLQVALQNQAEAQKDYATALSKSEKYVPALVSEGNLLLKQGKMDDARSRITAALAQDAKDPAVQAAFGHLSLATNHPQDARDAYQKAIELNPDSAENDEGLGDALSALHDLPGARSAYLKAVALDGSSMELRQRLATLLRNTGDLEGALEQLKQAQKIDPKDPHVLAMVGAVQFDLDRPTEAEEAFKQALALKDEEALAHDYYGRLLWSMKDDTPGAVEHLKRATEIEPKNADHWYQLGLAYQHGQMLGEAADAFRQATTLDPTMLDAFENLGNALTAENLFDDAIATFQKVLEKQPKRPSALEALGDCELKSGNIPEAIKYLEEAYKAWKATARQDDKGGEKNEHAGELQLSRRLASIKFRLGRAYERRANDRNVEPREALAAYKEATELDPKNAEPYYYLGYVYKGMNKKREAIEAFEAYLKYKHSSAKTTASGNGDESKAKEDQEIQDEIADLRAE